MNTRFKNVGAFLRADFPLTFKNSLLLTVGYLLLIPIIRGISNLNAVQSAQCLAQSGAFIGILIMVPITEHELASGIRDILCTKSWPYAKSILIRLACGFLLVSLFIFALTFAMRAKGSSFPLLLFGGATVLYALFLGLLGLFTAQLGGTAAAGYLAAAGYWSFCHLQIIRESSCLYFFPIVEGELSPLKTVSLLAADLLLLLFFFVTVRRSRDTF